MTIELDFRWLIYNKIEKELVAYKNEFNNKYVDDGYDAY